MLLPSCFDCRFFTTLNEDTRAVDLAPSEREKYPQGHCRRNPPAVGRFRGEEEDLEYDYAQWPLVLSSDWCGAFERCCRAPRTSETQTPNRIADGRVANKSPNATLDRLGPSSG